MSRGRVPRSLEDCSLGSTAARRRRSRSTWPSRRSGAATLLDLFSSPRGLTAEDLRLLDRWADCGRLRSRGSIRCRGYARTTCSCRSASIASWSVPRCWRWLSQGGSEQSQSHRSPTPSNLRVRQGLQLPERRLGPTTTTRTGRCRPGAEQDHRGQVGAQLRFRGVSPERHRPQAMCGNAALRPGQAGDHDQR